MRFIMMIKSSAQAEAGTPPDQAMLTAMGKFNEEMAGAGVMLAGEGLHASAKGARVRLANRKFTVVDGPFAEAKELVAGFWLVQTPSLQEAVAWAKRVPCVEDGEIELRRLWEMSDFPAPEAPPATEAPRAKEAPPATEAPPAKNDWREFEGRFREEHGQGEPAPSAAAPSTPPRKPGTTRFMVMLKSDAATESGNPPTEAALNQMGALMEELGQNGALLAGEGLRPSREGARVRFARGKRTVLDGPFSESKEMIAGYTIVQMPALADAVAFARRWLTIHVETGVDIQASEIEIRQVHELSDFPADASDSDWREREAKLREKLEGRPA